MAELKPCPFCGGTNIYETYSQEYALGTKNPEIFCNSCKVIFSVEDDSPYMNCEEDYIYRKKRISEAWNRRVYDEAADMVDEAPTIEPEPKTGRWLNHLGLPLNDFCSVCAKDSPYNKHWDYCPNCGAKMEVQNEQG